MPRPDQLSPSEAMSRVYPSVDLAKLFGHLMGDGHLDKRYMYLTVEPQLVDTYVQWLKTTFLVRAYECPTKSVYVNLVRVNDAGFCKFLTGVGIPCGRKTRIEFQVPNWIMNGTGDVKRAFLQALLSDECEAPNFHSKGSSTSLHLDRKSVV